MTALPDSLVGAKDIHPLCGATTEMTDTEIASMVRAAVGVSDVFSERPMSEVRLSAACELLKDHGGMHAGLQSYSNYPADPAAWLRWDDSSRNIGWFPECPCEGTEEDGSCALFGGHHGSHILHGERERALEQTAGR